MGDSKVYGNTISFNEYNTVFEREGSLQRVGTSILPTSSTRTATDTWSSTTSWTPLDNPHYALDPNGGLYKMVMEVDVMDDSVIAEKKQKGKKSLVSVQYEPLALS